MKPKTTKLIVVQYASTLLPEEWVDDCDGYDAGEPGSLAASRKHASLLREMKGKGVRIIERTITEKEIK